jgi:NADPH-dependent 2,4-dienoyl-CoA reductase/sulfur reductase-like enzyme
MHEIDRRQLATGLAALSLGLIVRPGRLRAAARARVAIIGGGPGGATVAVALKRAAPDMDVTLIEPQRHYTSCFYSNHFIGGFLPFSRITNTYAGLTALGINVVHERATAIDAEKREVRIEHAANVAYDRLVVAPGIGFKFDAIEGYGEAASYFMPHAWTGGRQSRLLRERLDDMENGGLVVIAAPRNPYRCPPGPYERVSMMAHVLKAKGFANSKIFVIDPKDKFSKQGLFQEGWEKHYPGMVEWYGPDVHGGIKSVDVAAGTVETDLDTFEGALLNVIPAQKAGAIAAAAGVAGESGFCPIDAASMRSTMDEAIFVIGDASIAGDMPKSGFSANSQAKVAAMTIRTDLTGSKAFPAKYSNTCWSLIDTDDGVKVGARYEPKDGKIASVEGFISQTGEDAALRKATYEESIGWYDGIVADMFS